MAGLMVFGCFCMISFFVLLGTRVTILHQKYFGEDSVNELIYPVIFAMICMSIIVELSLRF